MKILIRLPNWLGDVVMSTAFTQAVAEFYPNARVDAIIKKELSGIAALIPGINDVYGFSKQEYKGLQGAYRFGKMLRAEKYDLFFCLPDSMSSAVMGWATGAKKLVGYGKEGRFFLLTNSFKKPLNIHRVDEYVLLLEQFTGKTIGNRGVRLVPAQNVENDNKIVLINFNSEAQSRRMPVAKGISIIDRLTRTFAQTKFVFIGSPKESAYVEQFIAGAEHPNRLENQAGKTNLPGLANLMAGAAVLLTTDSGPAHLANSVGTPVVALFGAGNEQNTAPYNKHTLTIVRDRTLECEPCVRNTCKLYGVPKCMELLNEADIINALSNYINNA